LGNVSPPTSRTAIRDGEQDADWQAVVHEVGPFVGWDAHAVLWRCAHRRSDRPGVGHVRTFCKDRPGARRPELPARLLHEKAFPENEYVWTTAFTGRATGDLEHARLRSRIGSRNQLEIVRRLISSRPQRPARARLGDLAFAFAGHLRESSRAASAPRHGSGPAHGERDPGLGNGYSVFEPFAMWGRCSRETRSFRCMVGSKCRRMRPRSEGSVPAHAVGTRSHRTRLWPSVVAAGRVALGTAEAARPSGTSCRSFR